MKATLSILMACAQLGTTPSDAPRNERKLVREEHYLIELSPAESVGPADPLATARLSRFEDSEGVQLEWDLRFRADAVRVRQVERLPHAHRSVLHGPARRAAGGSAPRMVWRELRRSAGRTVVVDRASAESPAAWRVREWGGPRAVQAELPAGPPVTFLLTLLEQLRRDEVRAEIELFDPLSRAVESLRVERPLPVRAVAAGVVNDRSVAENLAAAHSNGTLADAGLRTFRLWRADGTLFLELELRGQVLETIQWGRQGLRARRVQAPRTDEDQTQF